MRLALVSVADQIGGSEAVLLQLITQVRRLRPSWDVHLVLPGDGPLGDAAAALGAHRHVVPMPASIARIGEWAGRTRVLGIVTRVASALGDLRGYQRRFASAVDAIQPDILHTNGFKAHVIAARIRTRAVRLWHIHEYVSCRPLTRRLLRRYGGVPRAIVANSISVGNDVTSVVAERLRRPVRVIYNGIDLDRFRPDGVIADLDTASNLPPAPGGTLRVGLVATFARWKGHETFLRALAQLPANAPVRGYVIGGPMYDTAGSQWSLDELRALAGSLGVESRVGFTGFQPDTSPFLRALDTVVHASTEPEPFGLVIAEAMATGKSLITTGTGGAGEIIEPESTAIVYAPGDPRSLAQALERLAGDASLRARLGANARAAVASRFDAARFGEAFVTFYESMR